MTGAAITAQIAAAAPDRSSWVAANAGSGKTRVLTNRVARLLLAGTDPARILCLTYTKAAAAEMQTRLFATLGAWAMLDEADLREALAELGEPGAAIPTPRLDRARTLFARALETPGGLKIQTIHAFCEALLRRFPLEAGTAPQFAVLDDRQGRALREEVLDGLAATAPQALRDLATWLAGDDPDPLLREIGHRRAAFGARFERDALARDLGMAPDLTLADLFAATFTAPDAATLRALIPILEAGATNCRRAAAALRAALRSPPDALLAGLESVLLTGAGSKAPFAAKLDSFPSKAIQAAYPALVADLALLMLRVQGARPRRLAIIALARSTALNVFARAWLAALDARKAALGMLDFDDMIDRTRRLLSDPATAAWVLWRLDGGIDHVLVDEAQDTSPAQWQVVRAVTDEFFAGSGSRDILRTVFVVGDEKQSIYSFQGADPAAFGAMRGHFAHMLDGMKSELQRCGLIHSFRSAPPILELVDAVFSGPAGTGLDNQVEHTSFDTARPGRVELWPFLPKPDRPHEPPWYAPLDLRGPDDPVAVLAGQIATEIASWLATGRLLPGAGESRPIRAGDVMILVQRRGPLFHAVIRALKQARVPVAGADLLRVGGELAVRDLLAALRMAATPPDDLSLAALLRSPLGGLTEEDLFELAHGRRRTLWAELRDCDRPESRPARALISDLLGQADFLRPFELLTRILMRHDGRRRLIARLGSEAEDGIDALLDQALAYEQSEPPSLTGFLAWIDRDAVEVKRRSEAAADQVRVMTVHGAKGLESPIVILPDTVERQDSRNAPEVLRLASGRPVWRLPQDAAPDAYRTAEAARRALARAENMRLLYVALTRAETWLIVCGAGQVPKPDGTSWYALAAAALDGLHPAVRPGPHGATRILEHRWAEATADRATPSAAPSPALPAWTGTPAPRRDNARRLVSPSRLGGAHALPPATLFDAEPEADALARGEALHLLLELLHSRPPETWPALAARALPGRADLGALLAEAGAVLTSPALAFLFAPGTLAEVGVTAALPALGGAVMQGRIDRLVVAADRILAVDFKSNRVVPDCPEQIPDGLLRQLGAYRAALAQIWPDRRIDTAILWTRTATLMPVSDGLACAALAAAG